jgi:hypothetical protein
MQRCQQTTNIRDKEVSELNTVSSDTHRSCSRLLDLPAELRDEIYSWVLVSTRITYEEVPATTQETGRIEIKSRPQALAILRTCRQINKEIGSRWINWVLFNFKSRRALMDSNMYIPKHHAAAIRHVLVSGPPLMSNSTDQVNIHYNLELIMMVNSRLQLDTFTVLGGTGIRAYGKGPAQTDYDEVEDLIKRGTGWKELHYITPDSSMLSFARIDRFGPVYQRKPQPSTWSSLLAQRDGLDSGSSVTIYRSNAIFNRADLAQYYKLATFEQVADPQAPDDFAVSEDAFLTAPSEKYVPILVVAKRGRNVDVTKPNPRPPRKPRRDVQALSSNVV